MKHTTLALNLHSGTITLMDLKTSKKTGTKMDLPEGCQGFCFVFESKKTAKAFWGKKARLVRIDVMPQEKPK